MAKLLIYHLKNRSSIILILLFSLLTPHNLNSAIIYSQVNKTLSTSIPGGSSETCNIDLDNDEIDDFGLYHFYPNIGTRYGEIFSVCQTQVNEILSANNRNPDKLNEGDIISGGIGNWYDSKNNSNACLEGDWAGSTGKFIALRLFRGSSYFYGWIRVSIPADSSSITIVDYALENTADKSILAGDKGIEAVLNNQIIKPKIYSFDKKIFIDFSDCNVNNLSGNVYDFQGKEILKFNSDNLNKIIELTNYNIGVYFIYIKFGNNILQKKIILY